MSEQTPTVTSNNDDVMLDAVTKFIADKEKFRSKSYLVGGKGNPTIGYGFEYYDKDTPVEMGQTMTKEQAIPLLKEKVRTFHNRLQDYDVYNTMTPTQKAGMISFMYNLGPNVIDAPENPNLRKAVKSGDLTQIQKMMQKFTYRDGEFMPGLYDRRKEEVNIMNDETILFGEQ